MKRKIFLLLPFLFLAITRGEKPKRRRDLDRERVKGKRRPSYRLYKKLSSLLYGKLPYRLYKKRPSYRLCRKFSSLLYRMIKSVVIILSIIILIFIIRRIYYYKYPFVFSEACWEGNVKATKYCIEQGANLEELNKAGETLLFVAAEKGYLEIVEALIAAGANLNISWGNTLFHCAAYKGNLDVVELLLTYEYIDFNAKNNKKETPPPQSMRKRSL